MSATADIQTTIIDALKLITKRGGYHNTVETVTKRFMRIGKIESFPAITVLRGPEEKRFADQSETLYECTVAFAIIGYLKTEIDEDNEGYLTDAADELIEDIQECLAANLADILQPDSEAKSLLVESVEPILDDQNNLGHVVVNVVARYYHAGDV